MGGKHCRLYDENLVHNIMISTGMSVLEYIRENKFANTDDICEFVEFNARTIIEDTIEQLNQSEENIENSEKKDMTDKENDDWRFNDEGTDPKM